MQKPLRIVFQPYFMRVIAILNFEVIMGKNEIDLYWLRARLRQEIPERFYCQFGIPIRAKSDALDGVQMVLDVLTDITGVDFNKIS